MRNKSIFFQLIRRDVVYSFSYSKYKYFAFILVVAILAIGESFSIKDFGAGSTDVFFMLLKDEGYFANVTEFVVPAQWIFIQFVTLFLISDYYVHDLENNSTYLHLRTQSKSTFILSKIVWLVWQTIVVFISIWLVIYLVSSIILGSFMIEVTPFYKETIASMLQVDLSPVMLILRLMAGFILTTLALSIIQLLLVQFWAPIVSFFAVIFISCVSLIVASKWLPAIHSMILKQEIFDLQHALSWKFSTSYSVALFIVFTIITIYIYQKRDML